MTEEREAYESLAYAITVIVVNDYINLCKHYYASRTTQRRSFYEGKIIGLEHDFNDNAIISYCFDKMRPIDFLHAIRARISRGKEVYLIRTDYHKIIREDAYYYDNQGN